MTSSLPDVFATLLISALPNSLLTSVTFVLLDVFTAAYSASVLDS